MSTALRRWAESFHGRLLIGVAAAVLAAAAGPACRVRAAEPEQSADAPAAAPAAASPGPAATDPAAKPPPAPPPPSEPAFHTVSIGRIPTIGPDGFVFTDDDARPIRVVLADADSSQIHDRLRGHAETVATSLLRENPVWVFPVGAEKGASDPAVVYARAWTGKGWLGETLIRAGYAARREEMPADALDPVPPIAAPSQPPPAPGDGAFASSVLKPAGGGTFEVSRSGKPVAVRLFDVAGRPEADEAAAARVAERSLAAGAVWVFPCAAVKPGEPLPVRVWTPEGWLASRLVQEGLAVALADPYKPPAPATPAPGPKPPPGPVKPKPTAKPDEPEGDIVWTPVTLSAVKIAAGGMQGVETSVFEVPYGVLRITWDCEPERVGSIVLLNLYRVDDKWKTRVSSHHVQTMKGQQGARALRVTPGRFWLKLSCTADLDGVKVEVARPKK